MPGTRELVRTLYVSGLDPPAIARLLGVSEATVYHHLRDYRLYAGTPQANTVLRTVERECVVLTRLTRAAARALARKGGVRVVEVRSIRGSGWALRLPGGKRKLHLVYKDTPGCAWEAARRLAELITVERLAPGTKRSIKIRLREWGVPEELVQFLLKALTEAGKP